MNKLLTTLIAASLAALLLAVGCGAWLFWQSWEEGRRLERENRELLASLEASRIRLDNFCEYPMDALCDVDGNRGTVSEAMSSLPEPPAVPSAPQAAPVEKKAVPEEKAPAPALSEKSEKKEDAPEGSHVFSGKISDKGPVRKAEEKKPDAGKAEVQKEKVQNTPASAAAAAPKEKAHPAGSGASPEVQSAPAREHAAKASSPEKAEASLPLKQNSPPAEAAAIAPEKKKESADPKKAPKKTWSSVTRNADSLIFRLAGAGDSLKAQGELRETPLCYEVTLEGSWKINSRVVKTRLVEDMKTEFRQGNTIIIFSLAQKPAQCSVEQEDARTIAVRIR